MSSSSNTPGLDASFDLLARIATDEAVAGRYPDGTRIIASDNPEFSKLVEAAVGEERPVAVVMPDGSDIVWRPRDPVAGLGALLLLLGLFLVKRAERRAEERPMFVPEDWVSEFHRAPALPV